MFFCGGVTAFGGGLTDAFIISWNNLDASLGDFLLTLP
jgi:hypothetical protein